LRFGHKNREGRKIFGDSDLYQLALCGVLALKKRGYPALADMKPKWQRKER